MLYIRIAFFTALAALLVWAALHTPAQARQLQIWMFSQVLWLLPVVLLCIIAWAALALIHRFRNRGR